jgi:hypothetical protein
VIVADTAAEAVDAAVAADAVATGVVDAAAIAAIVVVTADAIARVSSVDSLLNLRAQKIRAHRTGAEEYVRRSAA